MKSFTLNFFKCKTEKKSLKFIIKAFTLNFLKSKLVFCLVYSVIWYRAL